jgi:hypothetical protein
MWFRGYKMNQLALTKESKADGLLGLPLMFILPCQVQFSRCRMDNMKYCTSDIFLRVMN